MNKKLLALGITLGALTLAPQVALAEGPNWWGDYCDKEKSICLNIGNFRENHMGMGYFHYTFLDSTQKEVCDGLAALENVESYNAGSSIYEFILSNDNNTVKVVDSQASEEEGGCTKALFGTFVRQ